MSFSRISSLRRIRSASVPIVFLITFSASLGPKRYQRSNKTTQTANSFQCFRFMMILKTRGRFFCLPRQVSLSRQKNRPPVLMTVSVTQEQMRQNVFHHTLTVPLSPSPCLPLSLKGKEKNPRQHPALYSKITYRY